MQRLAGAIDMLTYITTYYNEQQYLPHLQQLLAECSDPRFRMIIVDDYSDQSIETVVRGWNDDRVSLFRVTEDKGFNSHGARNLAMQHTTTEWNVLIDIDYKLVDVDNLIQQLDNNELETDAPHFFGVVHKYSGKTHIERASINDFLVTKTLFWKVKGYDPEFIGLHAGDRRFIDRLQSVRTDQINSLLLGTHLEALRSPFVKVRVDPKLPEGKEYYSDDHLTLFVAPTSPLEVNRADQRCDTRHAAGIDTNPTPFTWEQLIKND